MNSCASCFFAYLCQRSASLMQCGLPERDSTKWLCAQQLDSYYGTIFTDAGDTVKLNVSSFHSRFNRLLLFAVKAVMYD